MSEKDKKRKGRGSKNNPYIKLRVSEKDKEMKGRGSKSKPCIKVRVSEKGKGMVSLVGQRSSAKTLRFT